MVGLLTNPIVNAIPWINYTMRFNIKRDSYTMPTKLKRDSYAMSLQI
jgi:hypothetical protein